MKKILYSVAAMALAFFSASCQQENLEPVAGNNTVTYTVQVADAVATKAIGDVVPSDMVLHYEVYRTTVKDDSTLGDGTRLLYHKSEPMTSNPFTINLELVNDQNFTVLFWAQASGNTVIDPSNLKNVTVSQDLTANQANYAAFSSVDFIEKGEQLGNRTISLVRPVSQINLGTTPESLKSFETPITMSASSFTVNGLSTSFNVATQEAGSISAEDFTFDSAAVPTYSATDSLSVNGDNYAYAAMNYVGFAPKAGSNVMVSYVIKTSEGDIDNKIENVPVKPNYRTNIVGNLITEGAKYQVSLDANWAGVSNVVCTAADLKTALENADNGSEVVLNGNIDLSDLLAMTKSTGPLPIVIPEGKEVVLDLNGFNIIAPEQSAGRHYYAFDNYGDLTIKSSKSEGAILSRGIYNNGSMTLESGVISAIDQNGGYAINGKNGSTFVMNGGKLTTCEDDNFGQVNNGGYDATTLRIEDGGAATINGGIVENISDYTYAIDNQNGTVVINGGEIKSVHSTISTYGNLTINGGSFICNGIEGITAHCLVAWEDSQTTINGGSFNGKDNYNGFNIDADEGAVVNITGGEFLPVHSGSLYGKGVIKVSGGTFFDDPSARLESGYKAEQKNDKYVVTEKDPVAKIGEKGYWSLNAAVAAVQDGETITLVADEEFTSTNYFDNGGWRDGMGYSGDKSFTIDLGGFTIGQDGTLNDYLVWIKNDGEKANTITFKNGTMDAGTTAYCALATSSSNAQKMTVNLENINLINNNSNGAVVKVRGGSELNVNAGTVITGNNSYVGIEAVGNNTVVNVYDGAKIYQNGTDSYVGAIIGASYNATLNIYGGEGQSARCGIIVMSTGATINVSGGEWTANGDGTIAGDNRAVLVSQNNRSESGWACKSILNVTGGTFKGGYNCYGMGPGVEADDAQINIKGGNFNADPASYVVAGYEVSGNAGTYTVDKSAALKELEAALANGGNVTLTKDVTLLESIKVENKVVLDLNGKTITAPLFSAFEVKAGGELTVKNGKVIAYESTVRAIGGKAIIESGEYTSTGTALDSPATYRYSLDCREGGELIINGGIFKSNNGMINVGSTVTINGGKFENIVEKTMTRHFAYVSAPLTINGGEFYGKANSSAGGCFFCGAGAGGDIQVNGGKFTSLWTSGSVNRIFEVYFGGTINVTGGLFNTNGGIATFVTENTDEATKAAYPYVAK